MPPYDLATPIMAQLRSPKPGLKIDSGRFPIEAHDWQKHIEKRDCATASTRRTITSAGPKLVGLGSAGGGGLTAVFIGGLGKGPAAGLVTALRLAGGLGGGRLSRGHRWWGGRRRNLGLNVDLHQDWPGGRRG